MQQANITSAQLSKQTGIGRSSISQWLSDKYVAKHDKVTMLATVLEVSPEWLLGTTEVMASAPVDEAVVTDLVDSELLALWKQLSPKQRTKWIKKGHKLLAKSEPKPKSKKKKRKQRK